jgi:pimeloyl-ACP methyl ester carboxylesterase
LSSESRTMEIIDRGSGIPVVLVPGIQGRWEWMRPAVDALSRRCRVITFSLADEPTSGAPFDERAGFDNYLRHINAVLDATRVSSAIICGISYGGLIAALFGARYPERASGVIVVSAIPPSWRPDSRVRFLMRAPRLLSPLFCVNSMRLFPEMVAAKNGVRSAVPFAVRHVTTVLRYRFSPGLMARRVRLLDGQSFEAEIAHMRTPALIVTGDAGLDRVVPVSLTQDYLRLWPHARATSITQSGHLGSITRPDQFADLAVRFAESISRQHDHRRRIVV